jgi:Flp pilus assembly protein TadG
MASRRQANWRLTAFSRDCHAVAAVEFAIVFPVLLAVMAGAFELSRAIQTARQLATLANSVATMLATNTSGLVTYIDLHYAFDSTMLIFPLVLSDSHSKGVQWGQDISVSMAGVSFAPTVPGCTTGCTYKAGIVWTGASAMRACGANPASAPDTAAPSPATLPADLFVPVTTPTGNTVPLFVVVVDVSYAWTPLVFSSFFGTIIIQRSAFIAPRYVSQIKYSTAAGDDGFGKECPGF